jgi:hypothetical protein
VFAVENLPWCALQLGHPRPRVRTCKSHVKWLLLASATAAHPTELRTPQRKRAEYRSLGIPSMQGQSLTNGGADPVRKAHALPIRAAMRFAPAAMAAVKHPSCACA